MEPDYGADEVADPLLSQGEPPSRCPGLVHRPGSAVRLWTCYIGIAAEAWPSLGEDASPPSPASADKDMVTQDDLEELADQAGFPATADPSSSTAGLVRLPAPSA